MRDALPKIRARLAPALAGHLVNRLRDIAVVVEKLPKAFLSADPDDNYLLGLAHAGEVHFLVTGDKALLSLKQYKSTRVVTPATLIALLEDQDPK